MIFRECIKYLSAIFILSVILAATALLFYFFCFHGSFTDDHQRWGTFGDYIGGTLNPIFGFLGLLAILFTIILQNRELKLTRDEMIQSKEILKIQNFERTFFEMLRLLGDIVKDINMEIEAVKIRYEGGLPKSETIPNIHSGRICFKYLRDRAEEIYKAKTLNKSILPEEYVKYMRDSYYEFAEKYEHKVGHYFRTLYRIFKFIHESDPDGTLGIEKKHYSGIARAMLSSNELALLFYDCFYEEGAKFAELIIEYSLFENMEFQKLFDMYNHIPLFDLNAYGEEDFTGKINTNVPIHFKKKQGFLNGRS